MVKQIAISLTLALSIASCTHEGSQQATNDAADTTTKVEDIVEEEVVIAPPTIPESETFYDFDSTKAIVIANPISYDVATKCYIKNDDGWDEQRVAHTNTVAIANAIFQAVYKGRLTAYDYFTEQPMTIDQVKSLEKNNKRKEIGKLMFTENWYFSEKTLTFTKKIEAVTLGYEIIDKSTQELHGFKPAFMVKLNEVKK